MAQFVRQHIRSRAYVQIAIVGLLLYLIVAGLSGFRRSFTAIASAHIGLLLVALAAIIVSYGVAATTYLFLSPKTIEFGPTFLVQIAGGLVNRLLPGGLGGLGINALYLKKRGIHLPVATAVVATNNLLGFIGNGLLLAIVLACYPVHITALRLPHISTVTIGLLLGFVVIGLITGLQLINHADRVRIAFRDMGRYVHLLMTRPRRSTVALLSSMMLTSLHATGLWFVMQAVGIHASWPQALLAVSAGSLVGGTIPTPGGIGGAEAGIAAVLVALGAPSAEALAAALVYRGLTYWLPLLPGWIALSIVEKRYL